jgi:hypothetical protein
MKRLIRTAIIVVAVMSLTAAAAAEECTPTEPKDTTAHIEFAPPGGVSVAITYFEGQGCKWNGLDQLNGFDGVVLDVEGQGGTGSIVGTVGLGTVLVTLEGHFLDADCKQIQGSSFEYGTDANTYSLTIPETAKWLAILTSTQIPSRDVSVLVHSDGKDCDVTPPPKKKKKKKKH